MVTFLQVYVAFHIEISFLIGERNRFTSRHENLSPLPVNEQVSPHVGSQFAVVKQ